MAQRDPVDLGSFLHQPWVPQRLASACATQLSAQSDGRRAVTIQDYGSLGELISAIATVVTLAYLAFQIRQNTKAVRAAAVDSSIGHSMDVRKSLYENDSLTRIYTEGSRDPKALSDEDLVRFRLLYHNILLSLWNIFSQTRLVGLSAETWSAQIPLLVRVLSTEGGKWFWASYSHEFEESFHQEVARVLSNPVAGAGGRAAQQSGAAEVAQRVRTEA